jgi:hypothetical protein
MPGLLAGWWLRLNWLANPKTFKLFVGGVLAWLAFRLYRELFFRSAAPAAHASAPHAFPARAIFMMSLGIGVIGGAYGIGGGAIIAPFCVALFGLPIHAIAGAAIAGTLFTSVAGVALYSLLPAPAGMATHPDWALGLLFGLGGFAGMYFGARCQKHVPQGTLKLLLGLLLMLLAGHYIFSFFA